jgi:hypothetical protein
VSGSLVIRMVTHRAWTSSDQPRRVPGLPDAITAGLPPSE